MILPPDSASEKVSGIPLRDLSLGGRRPGALEAAFEPTSTRLDETLRLCFHSCVVCLRQGVFVCAVQGIEPKTL